MSQSTLAARSGGVKCKQVLEGLVDDQITKLEAMAELQAQMVQAAQVPANDMVA